MDEGGFFEITGRIKELIVTSGGINIAPIPIESQIKSELPDLISNVVVIGDNRKYLTCLVTLKCKLDEFGVPTNLLDEGAVKFCANICDNESIKTIEDFKSDSKLIELMEQVKHKVNKKATANPHKVQKFLILRNCDNGVCFL